MKRILKLSVVAISLMTVTSCMTTRTVVGNYKESQNEKYTYAKGKQTWVLWGLIPLGRTNVNTPADGNCEITTKYNFGDVLITGLTGGIVKTYTIKVKAKRKEAKK